MIRVAWRCGIDFVRDVDFVGRERCLVWDRFCVWPEADIRQVKRIRQEFAESRRKIAKVARAAS